MSEISTYRSLFLSSPRFAYAWKSSLFFMLFYPFVSTGLKALKGTESFTVQSLVQSIWPDMVLTTAIFFVINLVAAWFIHRQDIVSGRTRNDR